MKITAVVFLCLGNLHLSYGQQPQPGPNTVPGYPPPTDFGCTTTFDAADLSPDDLYYYFIGQYLYTVDKLSANVTGPRAIADYFNGLTLPVVAAFTTGPLKKLMYIIDSDSTTPLKVFNFTSATPFPRTLDESTTVASKFTGPLPNPITAVLTAYTPAIAYIFGGDATGPQVERYGYNTATKTFTYNSAGTSQWQNTIITGASMFYNGTSGVFKYFLYDNNSNVAEVNNMLQFVPPNTPQPLYGCSSTIPPQMSGCCQLPTTTTVAPTLPATTEAPTIAPTIQPTPPDTTAAPTDSPTAAPTQPAAPTNSPTLQPTAVTSPDAAATQPVTSTPQSSNTTQAVSTTLQPTAAPTVCPAPDAIDLASDNLYYFFTGSNLYTVFKQNQTTKPTVPISSVFSNITVPVIAAFSTGPLNAQMYIIDSDPVNPLKIFKVAAADILPRIPKNITTLAAIFPSASTNIPAPLTAAFASTTPLRVYFIGGLSGAQTIGQYQYSSSNVFTVIGSPSTTVSSQWNEDIKAATTYFNVITGTNQYFLFSINQTARINTSLAITGGPSPSASCPSFQPDFFSLCCPLPTTTVEPRTTVIPPPPAITCNTTADSIDIAPDGNYYFFYGYYFYTANKVSNAVSNVQLIKAQFQDVVPPVIAAFSIGSVNARMFLIDSASTNNVKMYAFNSSAPLPVLRTGPLTTFFPSGSSIPQPLTAALSSYTPARVYFFGGSPRFVFSYSFNALSTTFSPLGSSTTLASAWPTDIQAATSFTFVNNGTVTLFAFNESSVARLDQNLNIVAGPSATAACNTFMPYILSPPCCQNATIATSTSPPITSTAIRTATPTFGDNPTTTVSSFVTLGQSTFTNAPTFASADTSSVTPVVSTTAPNMISVNATTASNTVSSSNTVVTTSATAATLSDGSATTTMDLSTASVAPSGSPIVSFPTATTDIATITAASVTTSLVPDTATAEVTASATSAATTTNVPQTSEEPTTPQTTSSSTTTVELTTTAADTPTTTSITTAEDMTTTTEDPCTMSRFCTTLPSAAVNYGSMGPDPSGGLLSSSDFFLFINSCVLPVNASMLSTGTLVSQMPSPIYNFYDNSACPTNAYVDDQYITYLENCAPPEVQGCSIGDPNPYPQTCAPSNRFGVDVNISTYSSWYDTEESRPFYVVADTTRSNLFVTDGVSYTGNPVSILTGQSVISAIALLQHVAYPGLTENDPPSHYLYVFGASDGGDAYFGVAQLPGLSTQQSVATALTTLQWSLQPVLYRNIYGSSCAAYTVSTVPVTTAISATAAAEITTTAADATPTVSDINITAADTTTPAIATTTTPNPCFIEQFCNVLPDSSVNGDHCLAGDPTGGTAQSPDYYLFYGSCAVPIFPSGSDLTGQGKLTFGIPELISQLYAVIGPIKKAFINADTNTIFEDSTGNALICDYNACPQTCTTTTKFPLDASISVYSTWFNTETNSETFFVAVDVSGTNFFVTDGVMNYGSPVSVTTNQNVITKVTAVEHVSNYTADGEPTVHYLHVFGTDVNSVKYFGVAQIQGLPPSTPVGVAAALPSIQWIVQPVPYSNIFGSYCDAYTIPPVTTTTVAATTTTANPCSMQQFCSLPDSAVSGGLCILADPTGGSASGDPDYLLFSGLCALPIHAAGQDTLTTKMLSYGAPELISELYATGITSVKKAYLDKDSNTFLQDSSGNVIGCDYNTCPQTCAPTGKLPRDSEIYAYSTWLDSALGDAFYVVNEKSNGDTFFVTDGGTFYGSYIPVATNQTTIRIVKALQHVSYVTYDVNGDPTFLEYLHVFGTDSANTTEYFGIAQIQGMPPSTPQGVANALSSIRWVLQPVPYASIFGSAC